MIQPPLTDIEEDFIEPMQEEDFLEPDQNLGEENNPAKESSDWREINMRLDLQKMHHTVRCFNCLSVYPTGGSAGDVPDPGEPSCPVKAVSGRDCVGDKAEPVQPKQGPAGLLAGGIAGNDSISDGHGEKGIYILQ